MFLLHDFASLVQMGSARRGIEAYDGVTDRFIVSVVYCLPLKVCLHTLNFEGSSKLYKHLNNFICNHKGKLFKGSYVKRTAGIRNIMEQPIDCWANYAFPCNPSQTLLTALGLN